MNNKMESLIELAYLEALKSPMTSRYGAILVYNSKVISSGYNDDRKLKISNNKLCCLLCG
jgi:deoxycytidylate deaminase